MSLQGKIAWITGGGSGIGLASALRLGVMMQEFDVRQTRDGMLACLHDATLDRTTDAARRLGPAEGLPTLFELSVGLIMGPQPGLAARRFADALREEMAAPRLAA